MSENTSSSFPLTDLSMDLGDFQLSWTFFEFYLEVISHRILSTKPRHTSILFASLSFLAKQEVTVALLKEQGDDMSGQIVTLIRSISQEASRNHLIHSQLHIGPFDHLFHFLKRDIKNGLGLKRRTFTNASFKKHVEHISAKISELQGLANITDCDLLSYANAVYGRD